MIPMLQESRVLFRRRSVTILTAFMLGAAAWACGGGEREEEAAEPAAEAQPPAGDEPRVFFERPSDGATVTSPVELVFGSENIEISAVPAEVETPREGVVHYHLGYDTDCLPPDTVIPKADPWIHFGDGGDRIEMEIPDPGQYRLTVQAGDDEHRTKEGLCETIRVTVE